METRLFNHMHEKIKAIVDSEKSNDEKLLTICTLLKNNLPDYDWVGFYLVDREKPDELILGPYVGDPTDHVRIKFGEGICGQAAERMESFIVDDVSKEDNYLSCSISVKSEIVVPIFRGGKIIGEIDIDSHKKSAFGRADNKFLQKIADLVKDLI